MLQTFLPLFLMTFFICLFIVLMQFLWRYVGDLVGKGLGIDVLAQLFLCLAHLCADGLAAGHPVGIIDDVWQPGRKP